MRKILWVGDAGVATGFERGTRYICAELQKIGYDLAVLGMHYTGDPHDYPFPVYPTRRPGQYFDLLGTKRLPELVKQLEIDIVILQNDVWNIPPYMKELRAANVDVPVITSLAIDGKNVQPDSLKDVSLAIFWTKFAYQEAKRAGWRKPSEVIPLGIDLNKYALYDYAHVEPLRQHARSRLEQTPGSSVDIERLKKSFIVLNVNRNQSRKRLDLTVEYFCTWMQRFKITDAYLMVQACPTGEHEYDIEQLMGYYGFKEHLTYYQPDKAEGIPESDLVWTYRCADVGLTTTQGEGFGLTTFEMMALGIPQIVPAWSALDEICEDAAYKVMCTSMATTAKVNAIGGVPDKEQTIHALQTLYTQRNLREELGKRGLEVVRQDRYRWENIGQAYHEAIVRHIPEQNDEVDVWLEGGLVKKNREMTHAS